MKKKLNKISINKLVELNPTKTRQEILAEEGLGAPNLTIDSSCHKKNYGEKIMLKKMKKYHKQYGKKLNTSQAKNAFNLTLKNTKFLGKKNMTIVIN